MTENQKKIFSLAAAAALTLVIVAIWFSFSEDSGTVNRVAGAQESKLSSLSPMQVIKDEFSKAFSGFNASTNSTSSTSSVEIIEATSTNI